MKKLLLITAILFCQNALAETELQRHQRQMRDLERQRIEIEIDRRVREDVSLGSINQCTCPAPVAVDVQVELPDNQE